MMMIWQRIKKMDGDQCMAAEPGVLADYLFELPCPRWVEFRGETREKFGAHGNNFS
ncbi:uncharacterized protein BO88DRAFT_164172 [Aspergillus vadensis CBS 113365]|uniref:Uncharacterized protein n=1 Tax=Aspergillus vadensis (strain CBS 113365 / IMI 142717 / IBT 24658) TaxID=1448311 RepID=A0A319BN34_ASPVC|nr:hypothetical protein BO88DRAFT_164172 [Aspergillus vadensis CBS 113365]PYH72540.1 hypothetical protein BO88DRAFT_164172 [Aspergillus vadensis CBS 113365]